MKWTLNVCLYMRVSESGWEKERKESNRLSILTGLCQTENRFTRSRWITSRSRRFHSVIYQCRDQVWNIPLQRWTKEICDDWWHSDNESSSVCVHWAWIALKHISVSTMLIISCCECRNITFSLTRTRPLIRLGKVKSMRLREKEPMLLRKIIRVLINDFVRSLSLSYSLCAQRWTNATAKKKKIRRMIWSKSEERGGE